MQKNRKLLTPSEYAKKYRQLLRQLFELGVDRDQALNRVSNDASEKISIENDKLDEIRNQFFVEKFAGAEIYLDRIKYGLKSVRTDQNYDIRSFVEKREVITGYYKNGNPKKHLEVFSFVRISSEGSHIDIPAGHTRTEAESYAKYFEAKIREGIPLRQKLEKDEAVIRNRITKSKNKKKTDEDAINAKYAADKKQQKEDILNYLNNGNNEQIRYLYRPSRIVLTCLLLIVCSPLIINSISGYFEVVVSAVETSKEYSIETDDELTFDCNLEFNSEQHYFYCEQQSYGGEVTLSDKSILLNDGTNFGLSVSEHSFEKKISLLTIGPDVWAVEKPDFNGIQDKFGTTTDSLVIYNELLRRIMSEKSIKINWRFSDDDISLVKSTWTTWKNEQEKLAEEKLAVELKAEEEARLKAEEEARAKAEEARQKAEEEARKKAAEEETEQQEATSQAPIYMQPSNSGTSSESSNSSTGSNSSSGSSSSGSGYSDDQTNISGYCKDGTPVSGNPHAKGRANVCYGHGGWIGN